MCKDEFVTNLLIYNLLKIDPVDAFMSKPLCEISLVFTPVYITFHPGFFTLCTVPC